MHIRIKASFIFLFLAAAGSFAGVSVHAQSGPHAELPPRPELAMEYNYVHSNAPAGDCGCINMNGGSASFAWPFKRSHISLVGDAGATHSGSGSSDYSGDLTLSSYTAGIRYLPLRAPRVQPWGQVLVGGAYATGSIVKESGSWAFASLLGGGLDLRATRRFSIRLAEADYLLTTFANGANDHQNNVRVAAGVVLHF